MAKEIIYEKIYRDIINDILSGELKPGDKIESELELAERYGVSRITSKKAMEMLSAEHIVNRTRGKGSFVNENALELLKKPGAVSNGRPGDNGNVIGVILDTFGEDFGSDLLKGIERECHKKNIQMMFQCTYGSIIDEDAAIERFLRLGASGLIILCAQGENYNNTILRLGLDGYPMVLVDRPMKGIPIPCVKTDNYGATRELTKAIIQRGNSHLCFVTHSSLETPTISERYAGFTDVILEHEGTAGLAEQLKSFHTVSESDKEKLPNTDEAKEILKKHDDCTAFIAAEYRIGILLDMAAKELGKKIEIATFDGISTIYNDLHGFISVSQDERKMGKTAVDTLVDVINGNPAQPVVSIPYKLNI
ncbi:MAG: GntR family transcriptional regulator [Lachnospiraceae bacterium]|nr:GntR family transcriptional regulator [Lachnospiraceae bacterium]